MQRIILSKRIIFCNIDFFVSFHGQERRSGASSQQSKRRCEVTTSKLAK